MYKDITTYKQGDKEKEPRILEKEVNGIKFTAHKHLYHGDKWFLTCRELNVEKRDLHTEDMEEAKEKAIIEMIKLLGAAIQKYQKALEILS